MSVIPVGDIPEPSSVKIDIPTVSTMEAIDEMMSSPIAMLPDVTSTAVVTMDGEKSTTTIPGVASSKLSSHLLPSLLEATIQ